MQGVDHSNKLLCCVRYCNVVLFAFGSLLGKIGCKGRIPKANILGSIKQGISQISETAFLHMRISTCKLYGLVYRRRHSSIG